MATSDAPMTTMRTLSVTFTFAYQTQTERTKRTMITGTFISEQLENRGRHANIFGWAKSLPHFLSLPSPSPLSP